MTGTALACGGAASLPSGRLRERSVGAFLASAGEGRRGVSSVDRRSRPEPALEQDELARYPVDPAAGRRIGDKPKVPRWAGGAGKGEVRAERPGFGRPASPRERDRQSLHKPPDLLDSVRQLADENPRTMAAEDRQPPESHPKRPAARDRLLERIDGILDPARFGRAEEPERQVEGVGADPSNRGGRRGAFCPDDNRTTSAIDPLRQIASGLGRDRQRDEEPQVSGGRLDRPGLVRPAALRYVAASARPRSSTRIRRASCSSRQPSTSTPLSSSSL
jgi:hypothetical protein